MNSSNKKRNIILVVILLVAAVVLALGIWWILQANSATGKRGDGENGLLVEENAFTPEALDETPSAEEIANEEAAAIMQAQALASESFSAAVSDVGLGSCAGSYSAGVYYFDSGISATAADSGRMVSASVVKVFIMEYVFVKANAGELSLNDSASGTKISSHVEAMIKWSDNGSTNALIDYFGMEALNAFFRDQGYGDTKIERRMLDNDARSRGLDNYTSLNDCMAFLKKVYGNQSSAPYSDMLNIMKGQTVKTKIPSKLPSSVVVANKTGELGDVENDIGIVFGDHPFALVVLANQVQSSGGAQRAIGDLALYCLNNPT